MHNLCVRRRLNCAQPAHANPLSRGQFAAKPDKSAAVPVDLLNFPRRIRLRIRLWRKTTIGVLLELLSGGVLMAQAVVNPDELRRFAQMLKKFNSGLSEQMTALSGQLEGLSTTWRDQENHRF